MANVHFLQLFYTAAQKLFGNSAKKIALDICDILRIWTKDLQWNLTTAVQTIQLSKIIRINCNLFTFHRTPFVYFYILARLVAGWHQDLSFHIETMQYSNTADKNVERAEHKNLVRRANGRPDYICTLP